MALEIRRLKEIIVDAQASLDYGDPDLDMISEVRRIKLTARDL